MFLQSVCFIGIFQFAKLISCNHLLTIPSMPFKLEDGGSYSLHQLTEIGLDAQYANLVNHEGETMIPPTLKQFTETFQEDLESSIGIRLPVVEASEAKNNTIFITLDRSSTYLDAAGHHSTEGYTMTITKDGIVVAGASSLGAWWGTRSLIHAAVIYNGTLPYGSGMDAPGWKTRGVMLDGGRHYYPAEFLIEMCSYLSFFKLNEFHIHLSDNLFVNAQTYTKKQISDLYSRFRLWSEDSEVFGLNRFRNESYTRGQFYDIQEQCAKRGITVIPELEAPAHALVITQWKPEMALATDTTLVNISYPETMPTLKTIWQTFLPWFQSKTVHIGADEYSANLISDYTSYTNEMNEFIRTETHGKKTRIWGTFTPSQGANVSKDVVIQHWASYEDNPYFDYIKNGYRVINSDMSFYIVSKFSGFFPQTLNKTLIFNGNPLGGAFAPHIFDVTNATNNPPRENPNVMGFITSQWNDYGPVASTYLEAYYAWRDVLPALADKIWGGDLSESEYDSISPKLIDVVPGSNLDRRVNSQSDIVFHYDFISERHSFQRVADSSGNGYHAISCGCQMSESALLLSKGCYLETPLKSKGRNYSLSFSVYPTSSRPGTLFAGPDSMLMTGNGTISNVTLITGNIAYSLNYSLPLNTWTDVILSGIGGSTFLTVSGINGTGTQTMEFLTEIHANGVPGSNGVMITWKEIAIEAPIAKIGENFSGRMKNITLKSLS